MKKNIFIYLFTCIVTFLMFTIDVDAKSLTNICYYKSSDNKLTFAVKVYDEGKSNVILTKSYSKDEFGEAQSYGASWNVNTRPISSNNSCMKYMKYTIKTGSNEISFNDSKLSVGKKEYLLENYDFESSASKCIYQGPIYSNDPQEQVKINVFIDKNNSVVYYYDMDKGTLLDQSIVAKKSWIPDEKLTIYRGGDFYPNFVKYFNEDSKGCPKLVTQKSTSTGIWFKAAGEEGNATFGLMDQSYDSGVDVDKVVASYNAAFYSVETTRSVYTKFNSYESGKTEICISVDDALSCKEVKSSDTEITIYSGTIGASKWAQFKVTGSEVNNLFKYSNSGDPSTLIENTNVYYNPGKNNSYYISTKCDGACISSEDSNNGEFQYQSGEAYKKYLGIIRTPLEVIDKNFANTQTLQIGTNKSAKITDIDKDYSACTDDTCGGEIAAKSKLEEAVTEAYKYCKYVFANKDRFTAVRVEECTSFSLYYNEMVARGVLTDLSQGCDLLSNDMKDFLQWILNVVRIAGPILAIILGSLDFVKVIFSGDADKEMKTAFNRFKTRLIAAALLFLVPALLSLALNALAPAEMNTDNPFCNLE